MLRDALNPSAGELTEFRGGKYETVLINVMYILFTFSCLDLKLCYCNNRCEIDLISDSWLIVRIK